MPRPTLIHAQLKSAREARGETLAALASRVGMREAILQAVEEGRFDDLPAGIYSRAAIRAYATGVGVDAAAAIAASEPFLRPLEDPVAGLAYLHGVRPAATKHVDALPPPQSGADVPFWAPIAAAAIDATLIMCTLFTLVIATTIVCRTTTASFEGGAAGGFAGATILLALSYFLSVGGLAGATVGEQLTGAATARSGQVALSDVVARAVECATLDACTIVRLGAWVAATAARVPARLHSSHAPSKS